MSTNLIDMAKGYLGREIMEKVAGTIGGSPDQAESAIGAAIPAVLGGLISKGSSPEGAEEVFNQIGDNDGGMLDNLGDLLGGEGGLGDLAGTGSGVLSSVLGDGKLGSVMDVVSKISGVSKEGSGSLLGLATSVVMGMLGKQKAGGLDTGGIMGLLDNQKEHLAGALPGGLAKSLDLDISGWSLGDAVAGAKDAASDAAEAATDTASDAADAAADAASDAADAATDAASDAVDAAADAADAAADAASDAVDAAADAADAAADAASDAVDAATDAVDDAVDAAADAVDAVTDTAADAVDAVSDAASAAVDAATDAASDAVDAATDAADAATDVASDAVDAAKGAASEVVEDTAGAVADVASGAADAVTGAAAAAVGVASDAAASVGDAVSGAGSAIASAGSSLPDEADPGLGGLLKLLIPLLLIGALSILAIKFLGDKPPVPEGPEAPVVPEVNLPKVNLPDLGTLEIPDLPAELKTRVGGLFGEANQVLVGVTDPDSATAALPALGELAASFEGIEVPEAASGPVGKLIEAFQPSLDAQVARIRAIPGVEAIAGEALDGLLARIKGLTP